MVEYWSDKSRWVSWNFRVWEPGYFTVRVILGTCRATGRMLTGGHQMAVLLAQQRIEEEGERGQYLIIDFLVWFYSKLPDAKAASV